MLTWYKTIQSWTLVKWTFWFNGASFINQLKFYKLLKKYLAPWSYLPDEVFTGDNPLVRPLSNVIPAAVAVPAITSAALPLRLMGERDGAVGREGSDGFGVGTVGTSSSRMCTNMLSVRTTCSRSNSAHEDNCKQINESSTWFHSAVHARKIP